MFTNVGDLYDPRHTSFDFESPQWVLSREPVSEVMTTVDPAPFEAANVYIKLQLFLHRPTYLEMAQFNNATAVEFALTPGDHALMLSHRFENGQWADASWQAELASAPPGLPDAGDDGHLLVWLGVIDSATGVLRGYSLTTWPPPFAVAVRDAIQTQLQNNAATRARGADPVAAGAAELARWMRDAPNPAALVRKKATIVVRGGKDWAVLKDRRHGHTTKPHQE